MCGIAGEIGFQPGRPDRAAVERIARTLAHRCPDGAGGVEPEVASLGYQKRLLDRHARAPRDFSASIRSLLFLAQWCHADLDES